MNVGGDGDSSPSDGRLDVELETMEKAARQREEGEGEATGEPVMDEVYQDLPGLKVRKALSGDVTLDPSLGEE